MTDEEASAHDRGHDPGIVVIPYGEISPGMMSIGTMVLHEYYLHMKRDGTVETTFTGMGMDSPEAFVKLLTEPPNLLVGVVAEGQLFGLAWLNHIGPNSAWAHFSALSEAWGKCTVEMGRAVLRYWWKLPKANGEPLFDVLIGMTPAYNRPALAFIRRLGFQRVGSIPKVAAGGDMMISYLERDDGRQ